MPLKIALVGCGKIADGHLDEIQKMPERARVVAVCDAEILMAEQLAVRYGIPAHYDKYEKMLEKERPDVVHITTPPGSHLALARAAVDAGSHVYVEKPLTLNHADSKALCDHVERAGKKMTIGYTYLFDPPALKMRALLAEGAIGDVVHAESWYGYSIGGQFGSAILADPGHWVHALPGKLFHNNVDHVLNKLTELIDDEEPRIEARAWRRHDVRFGDVRDELLDELRLNVVGKRVSAYGTFSSHVKPAAHFVRLYGTKNIMHVDYVARTVTLEPGATLPSAVGRLVPAFGQALQFLGEGGRNSVGLARGQFQFFSGMNRLIAMFYDSIVEGTPPPIATRDILRIALWMDRIFAQVAPGEAVVKILVTGATGFLGGALVESLLARGARDIRVTARAGARRDRLQAAAARHPEARVSYVPSNLTVRADAAQAVEGVDVVYHLAAGLRGAPADMFLSTVVGSKYLMEGIPAGRGVRVVLVSSFSVYGVAGLSRGAVVDENTPLEPHPEKRDVYAYVKLRQELLVREIAAQRGLDLVVLRPGVIYGPGGGAFSSRVGLNLFGLFLSLGGRNALPLSYIDNCADAIAIAGEAPQAAGQVYNVHDDELPTCASYLAAYKREVAPLRSVPVPYPALSLISQALERYNRWSHGQFPAIFTPYKIASTWGGNRFDNAKLKQLGWSPRVTTAEGMRRAFEALRAQRAGQ